MIKPIKKDGDWKSIRAYLAESARIIADKHPLPKCWYSELPQGDFNAQDVEHYRPKNSAVPINKKQKKALEKQSDVRFYQAMDNNNGYPWLAHDHRNYRMVTAMTNRGGAKHCYFPIVEKTNRLKEHELPWVQKEYPYLLDPTDRHDATLLFVKPDGEIAPIAPKTELTETDISDLPNSWHTDGFNYIRAMATIMVYRLNDNIFVSGSKEVYDKMQNELANLSLLLIENPNSQLLKTFVLNILDMILPSAPFSLSAKCALIAHNEQPNLNMDITL